MLAEFSLGATVGAVLMNGAKACSKAVLDKIAGGTAARIAGEADPGQAKVRLQTAYAIACRLQNDGWLAPRDGWMVDESAAPGCAAGMTRRESGACVVGLSRYNYPKIGALSSWRLRANAIMTCGP